jgi:hypothetical protein
MEPSPSTRLSLILRWSGGHSLLIRTPATSLPSAVLALSPFSESAILIHNGLVLDRSFSLAHQGVKNGDVLIAYERKRPFESQITQTPIQLKVMSIFAEVLKINDAYHQAYETDDPGFTYRRFIEAALAEEAEQPRPQEKTVIAKPEIGVTPLPVLEESSDDEEAENEEEAGARLVQAMAESIDAAAQFLAQRSNYE